MPDNTKKRHGRFIVTFDQTDPLQAKAAAQLNAEPPRSRAKLLAEAVMLRMCMKLSLNEWRELEASYLNTAAYAPVLVQRQGVVVSESPHPKRTPKAPKKPALIPQKEQEPEHDPRAPVKPSGGETQGASNTELDELDASLQSFGIEI